MSIHDQHAAERTPEEVAREVVGKWDRGPSVFDAYPELCTLIAAAITAERAKVAELRAEVREWLCEKCNTVFPGPPAPGLACVICPQCGGSTAPRLSVQVIQLRAKVAGLERERDKDQGAAVKLSLQASEAQSQNAALRKRLECARGILTIARLRDFSGLTESELLEAQQNSASDYELEIRRINAALSLPPAAEPQAPAGDTERLLNVARGCLDYGGGYRADEDKLKIFHHGIQTVINALEATLREPGSTQVKALESIGSAALRAAKEGSDAKE